MGDSLSVHWGVSPVHTSTCSTNIALICWRARYYYSGIMCHALQCDSLACAELFDKRGVLGRALFELNMWVVLKLIVHLVPYAAQSCTVR